MKSTCKLGLGFLQAQRCKSHDWFFFVDCSKNNNPPLVRLTNRYLNADASINAYDKKCIEISEDVSVDEEKCFVEPEQDEADDVAEYQGKTEVNARERSHNKTDFPTQLRIEKQESS